MSQILPRLRYAHRHQAEFRCASVDPLLPPEHPARTVGDFVVGLDIDPLRDEIDARPGRAGATARPKPPPTARRARNRPA